MNTLALALSAALLAAPPAPATPAETEKTPSYGVFVVATQQGNQVMVDVKIIHRDPSAKGPMPKTPREAAKDPKTDVLSSPRITLLDGTRGQISVGSEHARVNPKRLVPPREILYEFEGVKVDIIKPLNRKAVIVVTMVLKEGKIVFADAQTVKVTVKPRAGDTKKSLPLRDGKAPPAGGNARPRVVAPR